MSEEKLYATRDIISQEPYYSKHVFALTAENLHSKSDIAAELAHRDITIAELKNLIQWMQRVGEGVGIDYRQYSIFNEKVNRLL